MFIICLFLSLCLSGWYRGKKQSMKFAEPRIWRQPKHHVDDCFFVVNPAKRHTGNYAKPMEYPNIALSSSPIST